METKAPSPQTIRFGDFELDARAGELRKKDLHILLGERPLRVLQALVEHPGNVVTREELRRAIWPGETFVDFEDGLNHAVNRLRKVLGDSADDPRLPFHHARRGTHSAHRDSPQTVPPQSLAHGASRNDLGLLRPGMA